MSKVVLDASAVLAFINEEPGAETVEQYLNNAAISAANLSEVVAKLMEKGLSKALTVELIEALNLKVVAVCEEQAITAGVLRLATKPLGLSLGDRLCIALGKYLKKPIVTTDRQWQKLDIEGVAVRLVR
ncbi:hypothetical protein S7335_5389 [Synechococcus sp. PCC 7335]|uniref:type II toxin-antitoxin system VapC family toxin n=1 Tax=Synechococcus sp. (strain ATCC 29403 / PCC 7335) TaxID=91464 RepID=UPI00017ED224|nr:type II toxin-antitoxin system VapC family toxin [Synechococcus sp. PCC 7335]EDX87679.1 hypothetical protein S7335_5389 [Synechococcus sp. PCC 7335]